MPPNRFESEVGNFLEGSHGDRTHIKRAGHHTVTPLCGTLLVEVTCSTKGMPNLMQNGLNRKQIGAYITALSNLVQAPFVEVARS